ncbi:MAG: YCF48-related protein [Acidobacteriaceae bacterium]
MTNQSVPQIFAWILTIHIAFAGLAANAQVSPSAAWQTVSLPFRALNVATNGSSIWACGTDEGIAASDDGGEHWQVRHINSGGNLLLSLGFVGKSFGYAAGTDGILLTTEDAGQTWSAHPAAPGSILQASFSDSQHGLIRTRGALLFTADGGRTWSNVVIDQDTLKEYAYPFAVVALDAQHMAVMLKEGSAQYEAQSFVVTQDGGKSWQTVNIPHVTLYSFLRAEDKYWAIGTEVIHRERRDGGYAVPVALDSTDGATWSHFSADLSSCHPGLCVACTREGCISSSDTVTDFFGAATTYLTTPQNPDLTAKWASAGSGMCFAGNTLECTAAIAARQPGHGGGEEPVAVSPGRLSTTQSGGPVCIDCALDRIIVDQRIQGSFLLSLSLDIAKNGTVGTVDVEGAPSPEIREHVKQQVKRWIFEPVLKDGHAISSRIHGQVAINVLHPR